MRKIFGAALTACALTALGVTGASAPAGTLNWNDVDDPDPTKERLLNVATL